MKKLMLIIIGIVLLSPSCKKDSIVLSNCSSIADATILSEEEKAFECIYRDVYRYKGKTYTTLSCCVCDLGHMAFDCNNEALCNFDQNCMEDFDAKAKYLFAISED